MGNWTLDSGSTFILLLFMTSEAVNDELHASDPSVLFSQNTRLERELRDPTPHPPLHAHKYSHFKAKQIHHNLNKYPSLNKILLNAEKRKESTLWKMSQLSLSVTFFSSLYKWAATRSAQIQMQSDSFLEHAPHYIHLAHHGLNCHWQSLVVALSLLDMIWIGFM